VIQYMKKDRHIKSFLRMNNYYTYVFCQYLPRRSNFILKYILFCYWKRHQWDSPIHSLCFPSNLTAVSLRRFKLNWYAGRVKGVNPVLNLSKKEQDYQQSWSCSEKICTGSIVVVTCKKRKCVGIYLSNVKIVTKNLP
jgi:hypothetical protein